jgi:undecaprenyl-diphosphatase
MADAPRNAFTKLLAWIGGHELAVLLAGAMFAAGIWMFALLADKVMEGGTQSFDRTILLAMRRPGDLSPIGPPAVLQAAQDVTALGGVFVLAMVTIITAGFLLLDGKRHMALFLCSSVVGGLLVSLVLKNIFQRPRPDLVPHAVYASSTSFPSGHSMMSAVTYLTLGALLARSQERKRIKAYILIVAALLTIMIGTSRVYLGVHWPTDVLAGWTAGASWAILCWLVARWLQGRRALETEAEHVLDDPI